MQSNLLRTYKNDFNGLLKFNKIITPTSKNELVDLDEFIYHFYYSGSHSNTDFNQKEWANENDYSISELNHHPLVLHFTRN